MTASYQHRHPSEMLVTPNRFNTTTVPNPSVTIFNPVIGGQRIVSPERARKWVRAGLAEWADQEHCRILLAPELQVSLAGFHTRPGRDSAIGYDGIFMLRSETRPLMSLREMARIPIANARKAMGFGRNKRKGAGGVAV